MVFMIFDRWADLAGRGNGRRGHGGEDHDRHDRDHDPDGHGHGHGHESLEEARASIARGQAIFAPRAPYFHNGFAADLDAVVDFYDSRFDIGFTRQDKADLVAFLRSL